MKITYVLAAGVMAFAWLGSIPADAQPQPGCNKGGKASGVHGRAGGPGRGGPQGRGGQGPGARADANGDGQVTFEELSAARPDITQEKFNQMDRDGSGSLTPNERPQRGDRAGKRGDRAGQRGKRGPGGPQGFGGRGDGESFGPPPHHRGGPGQQMRGPGGPGGPPPHHMRGDGRQGRGGFRGQQSHGGPGGYGPPPHQMRGGSRGPQGQGYAPQRGPRGEGFGGPPPMQHQRGEFTPPPRGERGAHPREFEYGRAKEFGQGAPGRGPRRGNRQQGFGSMERPSGGQGSGGADWGMIVRNADSDANGEVTLDELQASVSRMNADRFARLDGDGDGVLTAEEFPTPRASNRPRAARRGSRADSFESQKQAAADLLDDADKDGNGAVTLEEVQAAKPGYPAENFEAKDKDNSGTITSEETTPQS